MNRRIRYLFTGIVQGVGFRPFIYRCAAELGLGGFVQNRTDGVGAEVEGSIEAIDAFIQRVKSTLPPMAQLVRVDVQEIDPEGSTDFHIIASDPAGERQTRISPDIATCADCLRELFDPDDRRHAYPFINCTNCGPRLTIIFDIPYDRVNTSMKEFPLCDACRKEYEDPLNRRFHAEPNACPVCGPKLKLLGPDGREEPCTDPLEHAVSLLKEGNILAIKGLGGFHLAVDATQDRALRRLRDRKFREEKPLAIMVKDIDSARRLAEISNEEESLLLSPERPIVLLKKRANGMISHLVAPGMATLGIMLPYTPLHHILLSKGFSALVMTSANQKDEPICIRNDEAIIRLGGIADYFLVHDREILVRCDDSIAIARSNGPYLFRRSRGYAPKPLDLEYSCEDVLALGPQIKGSICIIRDSQAFLSPHIGDLETPQAQDFLLETISLMERISQCSPEIIACDMHPGYYTSQVARDMNTRTVVAVQHHHAHIVSCMAENNLTGKVIGLAMDGTGYGDDAQVWGGEFLLADEESYSRMGHIGYFLLPGGEQAIHEPWRTALSLLREAYGDAYLEYANRLGIIPETASPEMLDSLFRKRINSPWTSSLGRVFDGVASLLGLRGTVSFEGQAAMELESIADVQNRRVLPYRIDQDLVIDLSDMIRSIVEDHVNGIPREQSAGAFHATIADALGSVAELIRETSGVNRVVLSGGCFQNRILLQTCLDILNLKGFETHTHGLVPVNDGGVSLGQAVVAGIRAVRSRP
ncbi:MAG: carbamoyltransferase HypF [Desulfomonilia bacterium]